ncbi:3-methyladenine DNA glycosylase [uncultured Pseudokineococcus sp.]|uniref:3-methyladenine DNA glycosylase n=1 Tax=uncultured Pseudokineococcus sp. TaxID=1642928 RepID=UPI00262BBBCD|nr:3-methyladenine DNA glycosylase [uncultured Pseudokineococcus sp.]
MPTTAPTDPVQTVGAPSVRAEDEWLPEAEAHRERVEALTAGHRERASAGEPHPVEDFLFSYYRFRPGQLARWHPGAGVVLLGGAARERLDWRGYAAWTADDGREGVVVDPAAVAASQSRRLGHVRDVVAATRGRTPELGCFGLHEWAMVHGSASDPSVLRHERQPLRLGAAGTDAVVEEGARRGWLRCTHVDAFRFYPPSAVALSPLEPTRETQPALEQPGCLHAGMDLYRAAFLLVPLAPSSLVLEAFLHARAIRELDMRASPYDLSRYGREPVRVETAEGRAQYAAEQRALAARGQLLRDALLPLLDAVVTDG